MKIFVSLKVPRGDNDLRAASLALAEAITAAGHVPFVAWQEIEVDRALLKDRALLVNRAMLDQGPTPQQFMPFVRESLRSCDLVLVLYHPELRGGLIELGIAYAYGIPIWLAHRSEDRVSSSALGCASLVMQYTSIEILRDMIFEKLKPGVQDRSFSGIN